MIELEPEHGQEPEEAPTEEEVKWVSEPAADASPVELLTPAPAGLPANG